MRKLIRKIHSDNSLWSPERIYDQLVNLGLIDIPCPNTIRKYLLKPTRDRSKSSQTWKTLIANSMDVTWSMDFFVVPTITFRLLYVLVIVSHERREIVHLGITKHPSMLWVINQLREATGSGIQLNIIRDNDRIYGLGVSAFLKNTGIQEVRTAYHSPWQNSYSERLIGTLRRELLNHMIPLNEQHLYRLLKEYIDGYYHPVRTHSSLNHSPPLADSSAEKPQLSPDAALESEPILGGLYHSYRAKAA